MRILSSFDNSRDGNDCYHHSLWQYVNIFGRLYFMHWTRFSFDDNVLVYTYTQDKMVGQLNNIMNKLKKLAEK